MYNLINEYSTNNFPDNVDFKSTIKGVQHGYDIHMAIVLGIAEVLAKNKESLTETVYFIFQPEEETPYFNDDFAYFQQKVPGVYFLPGGSNFEKA